MSDYKNRGGWLYGQVLGDDGNWEDVYGEDPGELGLPTPSFYGCPVDEDWFSITAWRC